MLLSLIGLTLLGVIVGLIAFYKSYTKWVFIAISYLMVVYIMGWQVAAKQYITSRVVEYIYDYEFYKTYDFHVVLYLPKDHITYIRDEGEFYSEVSAKNKPLLVRFRAYNLYEQMVKEDFQLTPLLPDVYVMSEPTHTPTPPPARVVVKPSKPRYTLAQRRWWYEHYYLPSLDHSKMGVIKKISTIPVKIKPVPKLKNSVIYPYMLLDENVVKNTRIVAHGIAKRFLRPSIEQFVLITNTGEFYVVKYTRDDCVAGRIDPNYGIDHEIDIDHEVDIPLSVQTGIKGTH